MNPKSFVIRLAIIATLALESAAFAQNAPNMPPRNPWLTDSVYPTSHFNPSATDSVLFAGPEKGKKLTRDKDVKMVPNLMVSNPTVKKIGSDTVIFVSGTLGIRKIFATGKAFESVSFTPYPGMEEMAAKADDQGGQRVAGGIR